MRGSSKSLFRFSSYFLILNMELDSLKSYNKASRNDISCDICTIGNRFNKLLVVVFVLLSVCNGIAFQSLVSG